MKFINSVKDYTDRKINLSIQLADIEMAKKTIGNLVFVDEVKIIEEGICLDIAVQQIPDVIKELVKNNIAVYSVIQTQN